MKITQEMGIAMYEAAGYDITMRNTIGRPTFTISKDEKAIKTVPLRALTHGQYVIRQIRIMGYREGYDSAIKTAIGQLKKLTND